MRDTREPGSVLHIVEAFCEPAGQFSDLCSENSNEATLEQGPEHLVEVILCGGADSGARSPASCRRISPCSCCRSRPGSIPSSLDERAARVLVDAEGLRLASGAIQGKHQMGAQTLPGRMAIDKCLNLADDLGVAAGLEVRVDSLLDHRKPLLLQSRDLGLCERLEFEVGQRSAAPEIECFPHHGRALYGLGCRAGSRDQVTKARQIDLVGCDRECVSGRLRHEHRPRRASSGVAR